MNSQDTRFKADKKVDELYIGLRNKYGTDNPKANGYRLQLYFLREQEMILDTLKDANGTILDIACGSGLMLQPLLRRGQEIIGVDFNETACRAARQNNIKIIRGDAYLMPVDSETIDRAINCQFLNQQPYENITGFIKEVYRVLRPGGKFILVWRNDEALIHRTAEFIYRFIDIFTGIPKFPYFNHTLDTVSGKAAEIGFTVEKKQLTFPLLSWKTEETYGLLAKLIGASCFLVLKKP